MKNKTKSVGVNRYSNVPFRSASRQFFGTEPLLGVNLTTLWKILGVPLENSAFRKYGIAWKPKTCVRTFEKGKTELVSAKSVRIRIVIKMAVFSPAWKSKEPESITGH